MVSFNWRHSMSPQLLVLLLVFFVCQTFLCNATSHHIRHYRERFKRQQGAHLYLPGSYVTDGDEAPDSGPWSDWSTPSQCSRSCGGGVSTQYRQCQDGYDCGGPATRHFSCNTQDCPDLADFRSQQCSEYDNIPFDGIMYTWIPYTKAPNSCELNCMPRGERFYYRHKEKVADGTRCNDEKLDVCVDGKCQPVGCDMMLGSEAREDKCRKCGGDGSTCKTISGTLDMKDLQVGYNDVLLIPAGATNIRVKERGPSNNYLAVRNTTGNYYLNGHWRIDFPSTTEFAGCKFHYERYPQGLPAPDILYCLGPIDEALFIVLLYQDYNVGIDYEYSVPKNVQAGSEIEKYAWIFDEYTPCTASCGGGVQYRNVTCAGRKTLQAGARDLCDQRNEPAASQPCNDFPCPPRWVTKPWQKCTAPCGTGGKQLREIVCEQVIRDGAASIVDDARCANATRPEEERPCNEGRECGTWHVAPWNPCDHLCGDGTQQRQVVCYRKDKSNKIEVLEDDDCSGVDKPESERSCNVRPCEGVDWVTSDWSGCDKCGLTNETRRVQCATAKGKVYADDLCDGPKPAETRECKPSGDAKCDFEWFASQWSDCSAKCGKGVRTRKVNCGETLADGTIRKVEDEGKCDPAKKYEAIGNCTAEKEKCDGEWFTGPWRECSKKCGGGVKERKVICLKEDMAVAPGECGPDTLPSSSETCNEQPCSKDEILPLDITRPVDESEPTTEPSDEDTVQTEESTIDDGLSTDTTEPSAPDKKPKPDEEEDEDVEYEIVEADTCDDGEWVEADADDTEEPTTNEPTSDDDGAADSSIVKSEIRIESGYEIMLGDAPAADAVIAPTESGSGDTESTYSTDVTMTTDVEGSGDAESSTFVTDATPDEKILAESDAGLPTKTDATGTEPTDTTESEMTESTVDFTGTTEAEATGPTESTREPETTVEFTGSTEPEPTQGSTTEFTGSTESEPTPESTTEFTGSTEPEPTEGSTTEFTGSTEPEPTPESTTEFTGSTEPEPTPESTTEFTGSTEPEPTRESTTEFTGSTEPEPTQESTTEFTGSTEPEPTPESTTEFTGSTEPEPTPESTTEFTGSTESEPTPESTTEFTGSTEPEPTPESTTEFTGSTESEPTPESTTEFTGSTEPTESTTEFTGSTDYDIWSTTETTTIMDLFTQRPRLCKRRKRKDCKKTTYGCCPDKVTPAKGPFDKGCAMPKTCKESEFGCCPDGVSQALDKNNYGCPKSKCDASLFGCCPDKVTFAKGNNKEGCPPPPPACLKSRFGCCKDNVTAAKGPNKKGCEPEPSATTPKPEPAKEKAPNASVSCTTTAYGCCPDGNSTADGPNYKGCNLECAKTAYGCCEDGHTPAHGYNREGCCLHTPFGCCPDNVKPAEGPNLEGCGCQYSPYKCCPDNVTPARGYDNEGCGCRYTANGCCPDQATPAPAPNYEGCPCHTYQFGCCPDGVTVATGPAKQGCGCRYSPHGCCSDEKTPAQGPNKEGCGCADSRYGCCYDGATEAQGANFAGCTDVPANLQESCSLARSSGECKNYTIKWYYDSEYGACSRFWYGGCEGNANRFRDKAECEGVCVAPGGKDRCKLRKVEGPCTGYYPSWYYDTDRNHCAQFVWGGCLGNNNRFETSKDCEDACLKGSSGNVCQQPKEEGPCNGAYDRWYFDEKSGRCDRFRYGGCEGNGNNFRTEAECMQTCKEPGKLKDHCTLSKAEGNCTEKLARWHHDATEARCMPFYYTGCGSNNNNFASIEECERECPRKVELDTCHLPAETGDCADYVTRWYFDTKEKSCRQFYYGGCGGNTNNFNTEHECKHRCQEMSTPPPPIATAPATAPPPGRPVTPPDAGRASPGDLCDMAYEAGECDNFTIRVYYDKESGDCQQFYYGGCGGNANNFATLDECETRCGKPRVEPTYAPTTTTMANVTAAPGGPTDKCQLPYEAGPCYNYTARWYYDHANNYCRQFYYGGCDGNANNFATKEECEQECQPQQPDVPTDESGICKLYLARPPCNESDTRRWYYDYRSGECAEFVYDGCMNDGNRFADRDACERTCKTSPSSAPPVTEAPHDLTLCYQTVEPGNCSDSVPSYYFDPVQEKCLSFIYTGCGGNANRYNTEEQCERQCGKFREQDVCNLPKETGPCRANVQKIYYDATLQRCLQFTYGGCAGNANRFSSMEECEGICIKHEEKKPNETSTEICKLPLDIGVCGEYHKRWYFSDERGECTAFIYTGCGGNFNRFKSFNECYNTCKDYMPFSKPPPTYVHPNETEHPCQKYAEECSKKYCPYGIESFVDEQDCTRCKCYNPCDEFECADDSVCAINLNINKTKAEEPDFVPTCRQVNKPGECPELMETSDDCEDECRTDADCPLDFKCCKSGCNNCVPVQSYAPPGELVTTANLPAYTEAPIKEGHSEPVIDEPNYKPFVRANEGDFVTLRCAVTGNPHPKITWRKSDLLIDGREARYRLLLDGALQIITLHKTDSGIYLCTADNKIGQPVQNKIELEVTDTDPYPTSIVDDAERPSSMIVSLGSPTTLNCYAVGYPFPDVTWFKDHELIPLKTESYEVRKDYSLLINSVRLPQLGIYTCQAYNGYGKAASWSVTVQALGPIYTTNPEDKKYLKYVVNQPNNPDDDATDAKPDPLTRTTESSVTPEAAQHNTPEARAPVWANIPLANKRYRVGTNITIPCVVSGNPSPRVAWYKDDHPVYQSEKYKIAGAANYTLTIVNADRSDAGTYVCEARNYYQDYSDRVTIDIEGVTIPADCLDNPFFANCKLIIKANYCTHVYYAKFCCRSCTEAGLLRPEEIAANAAEERRQALDKNLVRRK